VEVIFGHKFFKGVSFVNCITSILYNHAIYLNAIYLNVYVVRIFQLLNVLYMYVKCSILNEGKYILNENTMMFGNSEKALMY